MERWTDRGIVLGVRGHGEGGVVATVLTENHGRHAGYVHGGHASQRLRAGLQPGTLAVLEWSAQTMDQLGQFTVQDSENLNMAWLDDPAALCGLQSVCAILERSVPEREPHPLLFSGTHALLGLFGRDRLVWGGGMILWELSLLREMGFALDLSKCAVTGSTENLFYVSPKSGKAVSEEGAGPYKERLLLLPPFLWGGSEMEDSDIVTGLKMTGYFIEHRLFGQTTHGLPEARQRLPGYFEASH